MPPRDDAHAWVTLTRAPGLTVPLLSAALAGFGSAEHLLAASAQRRRSAALPANAEDFLGRSGAQPTVAERRWLEHPQHHLVPFNDRRFPRLLLAGGGCPIALYVDGDA